MARLDKPLEVGDDLLKELASSMLARYCPECHFRHRGTAMCGAYDTPCLRVWATSILMMDCPTDGCTIRAKEKDVEALN